MSRPTEADLLRELAAALDRLSKLEREIPEQAPLRECVRLSWLFCGAESDPAAVRAIVEQVVARWDELRSDAIGAAGIDVAVARTALRALYAAERSSGAEPWP